MDFGSIGKAIGIGEALLPLAARIRAAIATYERLQADPAAKQTIANAKQVIAEFEKLSADPDVKEAIATAEAVFAVLAKAK